MLPVAVSPSTQPSRVQSAGQRSPHQNVLPLPSRATVHGLVASDASKRRCPSTARVAKAIILQKIGGRQSHSISGESELCTRLCLVCVCSSLRRVGISVVATPISAALCIFCPPAGKEESRTDLPGETKLLRRTAIKKRGKPTGWVF